MSGDSASFLALPVQDRRDIFEAAARRLDTLPGYVEKDFWVCLVLDALYHGVPDDHPKLLFKGGTSLSKAFGLIHRFSEDIDLVVHRSGLGFEGERDPTMAIRLSNNKRATLFEELKASCSAYVRGALRTALTTRISGVTEGCRVGPDEDDIDRQTLFVEYPTLYPSSDVAYVAPRVRIEAGAKSKLEPSRLPAPPFSTGSPQADTPGARRSPPALPAGSVPGPAGSACRGRSGRCRSWRPPGRGGS